MISYILIFVVLLGIIVCGGMRIKNLSKRNQNLCTEICTMSNTFRLKGIEEATTKKKIKDLEEENKKLRLLC